MKDLPFGHLGCESCWCKPDIKQPCPECDEPPDPNCWRCGGDGLVDAYDDDLPKIVIHRYPGDE